MTPETLISEYLSLRVWLQRIVLPAMVCLLVFLYVYAALYDVPEHRDHAAAFVGFCALYFVLIRGGHIVMIRSMHIDLMERYEIEYRYELAAVSPALLRRKTVAFVLTQIKRDIYEDANRPHGKRSKH